MAVKTVSKYATVASQTSGNWSSITLAQGANDGSYAYDGNIGPGGGGHYASPLTGTGFGFAIPTGAQILGIKLTGYVGGDHGASEVDCHLVYNGGATSEINTPNYGSNLWGVGIAAKVWGGTNTLWGRTWTASEINDSAFGAALSAFPGSGTWTTYIDAFQITVYWDWPPLAQGTIQQEYLYQIYRNNQYLGLLPNVVSDFEYSQDINTAGIQLAISCAVSADTTVLDIPVLEAEDGTILETEGGSTLQTERYPDIVGNANSRALFRNGNRLVVTEYNNYHQNGVTVFQGDIQKWQAVFGGSSGDLINLTAYSDGADLANMVLSGGDTLEQSQTSQNTGFTLYNGFGGKGAGWNKIGQLFTTGSGITTLSSISILTNGGATYYVNLYSSVSVANSSGSPLASATVIVPAYGTATEVKFTFTPAITVTPLTTYFFTVDTDADASSPRTVYYQNTNVYANGNMYESNYGGGSGGGSWGADSSYDMWFKTWTGGTATTVTYTSQDPTNILTDAITRYLSRGGLISIASTDLTATSITYTFKVATIFEVIQKCLELAPFGWYWYVDVGADTIYFKQVATKAKYTFVKGKHITGINLTASTEQLKNTLYFTGGIVSTTNLFSIYTDTVSTTNNKQRLERRTDNRVTIQGTANAIGTSFVNAKKNESYETSVTVLNTTADISLYKVGDTVGFAGFDNFVDGLVLQIVRLQYTPEEVTLTLGQLPVQSSRDLKAIEDRVTALDTLANPTNPS